MTTATEWTPGTGVKTRLPDEYRTPPADDSAPLATFLGVFSLALGAAEVAVPHKVAARTGVPYRGLIRAYGLREAAAGVGILTARNPAGWLWARVAGDVLDLATLGAAWADGHGAGRRRAAQALAAVAGVTVLDILCARAHS